MKYCIDSCSLIDLGERHYPESMPVFEPIWSRIYTEIANGTLISVDVVKLEIEQKADDWRTAFLNRASSMFEISELIEQEFASVVADIEANSSFNTNSARTRFMSGADPWLIALARHHGQATIVTSETKNLSAYGLRAVSDVLGIPNISLLDYIRLGNQV